MNRDPSNQTAEAHKTAHGRVGFVREMTEGEGCSEAASDHVDEAIWRRALLAYVGERSANIVNRHLGQTKVGRSVAFGSRTALAAQVGAPYVEALGREVTLERMPLRMKAEDKRVHSVTRNDQNRTTRLITRLWRNMFEREFVSRAIRNVLDLPPSDCRHTCSLYDADRARLSEKREL